MTIVQSVHQVTGSLGNRNVALWYRRPGSQSEALVSFRLKGTRGQYVCAVSDLYAWAAEQHGYKLKRAKRKARADGIPWKRAKKQFIAENSI